jgi:hypothetical protein
MHLVHHGDEECFGPMLDGYVDFGLVCTRASIMVICDAQIDR